MHTHAEATAAMTYFPRRPINIDALPRHQRLLHVLDVRDFHFSPPIEAQLQQSIYMMAWQGYRHRDPRAASTWASVSGEARRQGMLLQSPIAACVEGLSGVGKTQACLRSLGCFPSQVVEHASFPKLVGAHQQVVWLSVEVPPSGKAADLARALMDAWGRATGSKRFQPWLEKESIRDGMRALDEWRQVAVSHFLGVLHLDEIQNLFKITSLRRRRSEAGDSAPELSIVEDQLLRWLLYLTNNGQVPLLVSGTPDGIGALSKRMSTLQRINTGGYHAIDPIRWKDVSARLDTSFFGQLAQYQYVKHPLPMDDNLARLIIDLTGGIQRIVIALWVAAHRVALTRKDDTLKLEDFRTAGATWLRPLMPAVDALQEASPSKLARYEDLVSRDTAFWTDFWGNTSGR